MRRSDTVRLLRTAVFTLGVLSCAVPLPLAAQVVTFVDPNLEAAVRAAISKPTGDILQSDVVGAGFTELNALSRGITNLSGIEQCTDLTRLYLSDNQISDIAPLASLTALEVLELGDWYGGNLIQDLAPLSGLTTLSELYLENNQVADLGPLANLTNMRRLVAGNNPVNSLAPLAGLTALDSLGLWNIQTSDLSALANLTLLVGINLYGNAISDIAPLANLTALIELVLDENQISDISPLSGLTSLTNLALSNNNIADISALSSLTNLTNLALPGNNINNVSALSGLTNLTALGLWENQITDIAPLAPLTALHWLGLADNQIADISILANLTNLQELFLTNNPLPDITPLVGLTQLFNLDVSGIGIADLSPLGSLVNLTNFSAASNGLTDIAFVENMTQLTWLNVSENELVSVTSIADLATLTNLDLSQNLLDNLQAAAGLYNLVELQAHVNQISDLAPLAALTQLNYVGLTTNQIFTITSLIANPGLGAGDRVELDANPLGPRALCTDIPLLEGRGVTVTRDFNCGDIGITAPVITTDGGNGPGVNFLTNQPALVLEGTCDEYAVEIRVNGSAAGVVHTPHATTWSLSTTLVEGAQTFTVQALDDSGAESPTDSITITLDATWPRVVSATALGATQVQVVFSEDMAFNLDLQNPAFYAFDGSGVNLVATQVVRGNPTTINITVNPMTNGGHYTVYVATASPTDLIGNHVDPGANSADFIGVNPSDADSDHDGLPDSWELAHDLDINTPSAGDDPDEDGLTNLEEFNAGSDPQNDADPPGDVYVATTGTDDPAGGSQAAPWRTIGFAMLQVARFATAAHRVTVHVAAGIYEEKVAFAPHTSLVGDAAGDPAASIIRFFNAGESEHVVMTAASDTALRNCTVTLPAAVSATAELLRVTNVIIEVEDAVLDGTFSPNALGVFITGPGSSASVVRNCTIRRLNYGVWASDSGVNITRNTFDDIFEDAISIRRPVGKQVGETPLLGDAGQLETSGFNQFGSVEDTFVRNNNPAETRAEFNDWGLYQREQIAGRIADDIGPVDFEPFLGKSILPGTLVVAVLDAATETPIPGSAHPAASTGAIDGEYDTTSGLHFFATLDPAAYTIEVAADGYVAENREVTVVAGDITAATFYLAGAGEITLRAAAQDLTDSFSAADTDDDGRLSFTEARAQVPALTQAQFDQIDTSNDGLLAQAELEAVLEVDDGGLFNCRRTLRSLGIKGAFGNLFLAGLAFVCLQAGRRNRTS